MITGKRFHWVVQITGVVEGVANVQIAEQLARQSVSVAAGMLTGSLQVAVSAAEETPEFLAEKQRLEQEAARQMRDGQPAGPLVGRRRGAPWNKS